jgi:hypothetical protein
MHKPYFYIIRHERTNMLYAGSKYGTGRLNKPNSETFLTEDGYQTSSNIIKNIIEEEGLDSFAVLRLRHFDSAKEAVDYEARFLKRVDAKNNQLFYNQSNADGGTFRNKGGYKLSDGTKLKMRKPKSPTAKANIQASKERRDCSECGKKAHATRVKNGNDKMKPEQIEMIKHHNSIYWNDKIKEEHSDRMKQYYVDNPISDETRKKTSASSSGENNGMFGKKQSESTREKMKLAWAKRKEQKLQTT